jgi:hypothetical protein
MSGELVRIAVGAFADLLAISGHPLEDIGLLNAESNAILLCRRAVACSMVVKLMGLPV